MIQRIQTLYLLVVAIMMATLFATEPATLSMNDEILKLGKDAILTPNGMGETGTILLRVYAIAVFLLALLDIILFRKRKIQMRLTVFCLLLSFGYYFLLAIYLYSANGMGYEIHWSMPVTFPLVSVILLWLAFRAILKDELLIRSIDRVR